MPPRSLILLSLILSRAKNSFQCSKRYPPPPDSRRLPADTRPTSDLQRSGWMRWSREPKSTVSASTGTFRHTWNVCCCV